MFTRYGLPLLAIVGVVFAIAYVSAANKPVPTTLPIADPARPPYAASIAGAGLVEPSTEVINVGTPVAGIVMTRDHWIGDDVRKGDVLFTIDSRDQRADLTVRLAQVESARANESAARALAEDAGQQWEKVKELTKELTDPRAVSREEVERRQFAKEAADAKLAQAHADVVGANAAVEAARTELDRRVVRASVDGRVLQCKVHLGEYAPAGPVDPPLMMVGDVSTLHVRVDVDENDAWRLRTDRPAMAYVRGNRDLSVPLTFAYVEPAVIPKKSLTGDSAERVDTRVLQVVYSFDPKRLPVFVGQQMDVFIEAAPIDAARPAAVPTTRP